MMLVNAGFSQTKLPAKDVPSKQPTIYIGMELQLGMSRDGVITHLAATYKVVKVQGEEADDWIVEEKNDATTIIGALGLGFSPVLVVPARYCVSTHGRGIRGPRNPVQVCDVGTHPHMHATCSLWSKSLDRFGSQHVHAPGEQRAAPYPPDAAWN
jgi:hypothetical protein